MTNDLPPDALPLADPQSPRDGDAARERPRRGSEGAEGAPAAVGTPRISGRSPESVRPRRAATLVLLGAAIGLTLLRFLDLRTAPFINDEPAFQLMIDRHLAAHTLPTHALVGNKGVVYGPTALWLYMPVRLFTDDVACIVAAHVLLHCAGLVLLFLAVRASVSLEAALWTWLLVAASPYLFFYARLPWDNTFLIPLVALVLFLAARLEKRPRSAGAWVGLGAACGLIFNLHLMAIPVIAAAAVATAPIAWKNVRSRAVQAGVPLGVLAAAIVVAPYLLEVGGVLLHGSQFAFTTQGLTEVVPETLQSMRRYLSAEGMDYFLDRTNAPVLQAIGPLDRGFDLAWIVALAGLGGVIAATWNSAVRAVRRRPAAAGAPVVVRFGLAFFWFFLFYYYGVRPHPFHPHYVISAFWVLPFFAAWSLGHLPRLPRAGLQAAMVVLVVSDVAFATAAHAQIVRNHGTRGYHYSSIPGEVRTATRDICRAARAGGRSVAVVDLRRVPGVLPMPFEWFDHHLADCAGIDLAFSGGARAFRVFYGNASPYDARLRVATANGGP